MDDNWLSGGCQILRFPGFIVSPDRKKVFKNCKVYRSTVDMAKQARHVREQMEHTGQGDTA